MSEGCEQQPPPSASADRGNEHLSLGAAAFAVAVALLFYTWWLTLAAGAVCGCAVALCVARSHHVRAYFELAKLYLQGAAEPQHVQPPRSCGACGAPDCARHDPRLTLEPWAGLRLHKQLDKAIEDFYNAIIDNFVSSWYKNITRQPFFVDELRHQLRYASAALIRRAYKVNYAKLIVEKLVPCALHHHAVWTEAQRQRLRCEDAGRSVRRDHGDKCSRNGPSGALAAAEAAALAGPLGRVPHPAARGRAAELRYLRCVTEAIMPFLLRASELRNRVFQVLIREIFAGWVLLALTDVLADPYILNTLVVLATGDGTMAPLPETPNYRRYPYLPSIITIFLPRVKVFPIADLGSMVEFLEQFARQSDAAYARRARLLRVDAGAALGRQDCLYAFCRDIEPFQMKILNPDLTPNEEVSLFNEAWDLYVQYYDADSPTAVPFQPAVVDEMRAVLSEGAANVKKLQTSKALYQSAKYAEGVLENVFIPKFLHSEEFYKLLIGPRVPTGYHKQATKKSQEKLVATAIRIGSKIKGALRSQTIEGQILDVFTNSIDINTEGSSTDGDGLENMDILRYLDSLAEHTKLEEHDLRNWRVTITHADSRQPEGKRTAIREFTLAVQRATPLCAEDAGWSVRRTENDFHLLRSKLTEFHGDALLQDLSLPSRRDNSPLETLRYKYEDYVQRLLQKSLLATSELLRIFLSAEGDFALAVQRASLVAGGADLANIYQSVAHRLRKEKGQHLEPFMSAFLLSSDVERYQAMKQVSSQPVEEAVEAAEAARGAAAAEPAPRSPPRDITGGAFGNNFDVEGTGSVPRTECAHQTRLTGFTQCLMYFLVTVVRARGLVCGALGCALAPLRGLVDRAFNSALNAALADVLSHQRLAHLIRLGHELLFERGSEGRRHTAAEQSERARAQLLARVPRPLTILLGRDPRPALADLHAMLQSARLNKQLVYNLLDLCIAELFPELIEDSPSLKRSR